MKPTIFAAAVLASLAFAAPAQASIAHLTLTGIENDWITLGNDVDNVYSSADPDLFWNFARATNIGTAAAPAVNDLSFTFLMSGFGPSLFADLDFSTRQLGTVLTVGTTYTDAQRAPFAAAGHAGLNISYDHRGCNTLSGSYTVNQLSFKGSALDTFGASFSQSCDGGALMNGTFYYNASVDALPTVEVPEPGSLALFGLAIAGLGIARRRKPAL